MCDEELAGHVELEIIDVQQQPALVVRDQIIAAPTLVKRLPGPLRRIAGLALAFHLVVTCYEEPRLRARFGEPYEAYLGTVRRWRPRPPGGASQRGPAVVRSRRRPAS